MWHLFNLVVSDVPSDDDVIWATRLAVSVLKEGEKPSGLPRQMWLSAKECADSFLREGYWFHHLFLCLLLVQRRDNEMPTEEIIARKEIEEVLMYILFGSWTP